MPNYYKLPSGATQLHHIIADKPYNVATAIAYLYRAGAKPGNDAADDIRKAMAHLAFELERLQAQKQAKRSLWQAMAGWWV